jgi:hypothetical protein
VPKSCWRESIDARDMKKSRRRTPAIENKVFIQMRTDAAMNGRSVALRIETDQR